MRELEDVLRLHYDLGSGLRAEHYVEVHPNVGALLEGLRGIPDVCPQAGQLLGMIYNTPVGHERIERRTTRS